MTLRWIVCLFVMLQAASSSQAQAVFADHECKLFKSPDLYRETRNFARGYLAGLLRSQEVLTGVDLHRNVWVTDVDNFVFDYCKSNPQENVSVAVEELFKRVMQNGSGK